MQLHRGILCGMMGKKGGKAMGNKKILLDLIENKLRGYAEWVRDGKGIHSKAAEDFYRELLNLALGYDLRNMNRIKDNFPAIDLGNDRKLAVQVTSTGTAVKVKETLERFYRHKLNNAYDQLIVLVAGSAECAPTKVDHPGVELRIWGTRELVEEFRELPQEKLEEILDFLKRRVPGAEVHEPLLYLPIGESLGVDGFVGREAELAEMAQAIADGVKPVVLWGLGGMGKTELACQFGRKYTAGRVFFARFRESFYGTVADSVALGIPGVAERPLDGAQRYGLAMEQLGLCSEKDVLIVDNADGGSRFEELKDETYRALCALPLRLVVTTRHKVNRAIEVRRLENGELYRIFENHEATVTREQMDALIAAAEGHTLTVDLMARTLAQSWGTVKPEDILRALDEGNLAQKQFPAVYSDHDPREARRQERIYARLAALFDLSAIGEAGRTVLGCATLLPEGGMEESLFYLALPEALREELDSLEKRGWLSREKGMLRIHPMVRLVCRTELKPSEENCKDFLFGIRGQYDRKQYDHEKFRQMAEVFETASNLLEDKTGVWAGLAGYLWHEVAETQRALACSLRSVEKREQHQPDSNNLAAGYNNVGMTYGALGDHKQALEYQMKALEIRERVLPPEHPDLARSYNNVGATYSALGDHKQALEYKLKALGIRERVLPGNHPSLARSFNNIAWTYYRLGRIGEAAAHMRRAVDIINRAALPETHPHRVNFNKWADRLEAEARQEETV